MVEQFLEYQVRAGMRPATIANRRLFLLQLQRHVNLAAATTDDLQRWLDALDLQPRTRVVYVATMRAFYLWACREGLVGVNPAVGLVRPRLPRLMPRPVSEADVVRALEGTHGMLRAWLVLAAYQGLRCYEMAHQLGSDVYDDRLIVSDGKGGHQRMLPLHALTADALAGFPRSGLLFVMNCGRPWRAGTISMYVSRHLRSRGVDASAHQLRHRFATRVYAQSHDLLLTQTLLGHQSPLSTAIYAAVDQSDAARVMRAI